MAMIKWIVATSAAYAALETKDVNALYFLSDTGELYKGSKSFTEGVILVDEFPAKGALGKMYIHNTTLEGKVWTGSAWKTVIEEVAKSLTDDVTTNVAVTGEAIKAYVTAKFAEQVEGKFVEGITYDKATKDLKFTKDGAEQIVPIDGFVTGAAYNGSTGVLSFQVEGGTAIDINLPKENFVSGGSYDTETHEIVLTLTQGGEVRIPATDLVDVYTVKSTNSVNMTMTDNEISAEVKISATAGNLLKVNEDGLFAQETDISGKIDKVAAAKAGEIVIAKADGHVETSGYVAGTAAISATPNANTLATEAAVSAIKVALQGNIDAKFDKSKIRTSATVATKSTEASDEHVLSEKLTLAKLEALDTKKIDKANVVTTIDAVNAADDKVVAESALVAAMSWTVIN